MLSITKPILFISALFILSFPGCSDELQHKEEKSSDIFTVDTSQSSEQVQFLQEVKDSLRGDVVEYNQNEFVLYFNEDSYSYQKQTFLLKLIESSLVRIKEVLDIKNVRDRFYIVMLASREEMNRMIGMKVKGLAYKRFNTGFFVFNSDIRPYFRHELFHLIANQIWGECSARLLDEGGAVYTDNECLYYENPISTINKYLYEKDMWFNINDLIENFNDIARKNDLIAYLQSAFIFRLLYESYGIDKMKELWQKGFSQFENIYGFTVTELQKKIEKELGKIEYTEVDWDELMNKGCG